MCWRDHLHQSLKRLSKGEHLPRLAVVGIGNELRGDDSAGLLLARAIQQHPGRNGRLMAVEACSAPENFVGTLCRFHPDLVLMVDAARMEEQPGEIRWLDWKNVRGLKLSTHTLPLNIFASYLIAEMGCEVALLGIQLADTTFDSPPCPAVLKAVDAIFDELVREDIE